ncbi:hypothetical protein DFH28DRAFT_934868 [Melampsora americana]|nr:hypothetical protein DFH28DRAFT_934868 [Melampsora americana]
MEKKKSSPNLSILLTLILIFVHLSVDGAKLLDEDRIKTIVDLTEYQISNPNSDFNLRSSHQIINYQLDHQNREIGKINSNSPIESSSNLISNSNPNNQLPQYHHKTDHEPSTSSHHPENQLASTSNVPSPDAKTLNLDIPKKVTHSIYDPNTMLHTLEPMNSELLRTAHNRLQLGFESMIQTWKSQDGVLTPELIKFVQSNIFQAWGFVLDTMKTADVRQLGIPTEFLKKVIDPVINHLIIRRRGPPDILTSRRPGSAPVNRIVALWARFWRLLVNTEPKPILNDNHVSGGMDWIIHLVLLQIPINPTSVSKELAADPTNLELRISNFIVALDKRDALDGLAQDLFDLNLRNQVHHFYNGLVRTNIVAPSILAHLRTEVDGQSKLQLFGQYQQYRQDRIILRCALSGVRRSDPQFELKPISPIYDKQITQKFRHMMIDRAGRIVINQLRSTLMSRSPSFKDLSPFRVYLHEDYVRYIKYLTSPDTPFDHIIDTYLMPLRIWLTISTYMNPGVEVKLGQDMWKFLDLKVRQGVQEERIYNWIYIIHFTCQELPTEMKNQLKQRFIKKKIQDWISGQGSLIQPQCFDLLKLQQISRVIGHELKLMIARNSRTFDIPPVPRFATSNPRKVFEGLDLPSTSISFQQVSKSPSPPKSPDPNVEFASKYLHLSPPSTSDQVEKSLPVPNFLKPNPGTHSPDFSPIPEPHEFFKKFKSNPPNLNKPNRGSMTVPFSSPDFLESSLEDSLKPSLKSRLGKSWEVNEDEEKEIDGFLNDHEYDHDHHGSDLEKLINSSRRRKLDQI